MSTNEDRLKSLSTTDLAKELAAIALWDKQLISSIQKTFGLEEYMKMWLLSSTEPEPLGKLIYSGKVTIHVNKGCKEI